MAFEDLKAELRLLLGQMESQPEDLHELYLTLREKLNELRALGMDIPEDLASAEKAMEARFLAEGPQKA